MNRTLLIIPVIAATFVVCTPSGSPAWAQQAGAQQSGKPDPCQPNAETTGRSTQTTSEYAKSHGQPMEHSAIVPSAGGHQESAAPTVQQDRKPVEASTECPKPPNQIDAPTR